MIVSRQSLEWWLSRYVVKQVKENTKSDEDSKEDYHMEVDGLESSDTIICEHGGLDPVKASNMKRILKVEIPLFVYCFHSNITLDSLRAHTCRGQLLARTCFASD